MPKCIICGEEILISKEKVQLKCCRNKYHAACLINNLADQQKRLLANGAVAEEQDLPVETACPLAACDQVMDERLLQKLKSEFPEIWEQEMGS